MPTMSKMAKESKNRPAQPEHPYLAKKLSEEETVCQFARMQAVFLPEHVFDVLDTTITPFVRVATLTPQKYFVDGLGRSFVGGKLCKDGKLSQVSAMYICEKQQSMLVICSAFGFVGQMTVMSPNTPKALFDSLNNSMVSAAYCPMFMKTCQAGPVERVLAKQTFKTAERYTGYEKCLDKFTFRPMVWMHDDDSSLGSICVLGCYTSGDHSTMRVAKVAKLLPNCTEYQNLSDAQRLVLLLDTNDAAASCDAKTLEAIKPVLDLHFETDKLMKQHASFDQHFGDMEFNCCVDRIDSVLI